MALICLPAEDNGNPGMHKLQLGARQFSHRGGEQILADSDDLRHVHHRIFGQCCLPRRKRHVPHTTVAIRLRLIACDRTTATGLRNPGPEPAGSGRSAQQISPCEITTRSSLARGAQRTRQAVPSPRQFLCGLDPWPR